MTNVAAGADKWTVTEDGCLVVNDDIESVIYHPSLNVVLVTSKAGIVRVIDVASGAIIHASDLSGMLKLVAKIMINNSMMVTVAQYLHCGSAFLLYIHCSL